MLIYPDLNTQMYNYFVAFLLTDIDECAANSHDCHLSATCTNTDGSFACACNEGYTGDGRKCSGELDLIRSVNHTKSI